MFRTLLVRACRVLLDTTRELTQAIEQGVIQPSSNTEENIAWGKRWIAGLVAAFLAGDPIVINHVDLVMLVFFFASIVVARRARSRSVIVYAATYA